MDKRQARDTKKINHLKQESNKMQKINKKLAPRVEKLEIDSKQTSRQVTQLKAKRNTLSAQLKAEKEKSREVMASLMEDSAALMESIDLLQKQVRKGEQNLTAAKKQAKESTKAARREERGFIRVTK